MSNKIILGHPFGNANVRQALLALSDADLLESFVTTVCAEHVPLVALLPDALRDEVRRRSFSMVPRDRITSHPLKEFLRLTSVRLGRIMPGFGKLGPSVDDVWHGLDVSLAMEVRKFKKTNPVVYAYEDGALAAFSSFPDLRKIYELPIGYWKSMHSLLREESTLKPEWSCTLLGLADTPEKLERKDAELELSDEIIVPSDFVKSTLPSHWGAKVNVLPYGCPASASNEAKRPAERGPLNVLFCGSLGQRKGISYLFETVERMGRHISLTVVGSEIAPCPALQSALAKVTWHRSLPHHKILELMRRQDVFLFPTLFEGRALVVLEALSQGLPVITTSHSGTGDVVLEGQSGFVVPIRSVDAMVHALETLYDDRGLLAHMKEQALVVASKTTWAVYRENFIRVCAQTANF